MKLAGLLFTALGVALLIWARAHLGANGSGAVSIRAGHELIRTGPYRRIRHPIYTGMLLAAAGTALVVGQLRGLLAVAICFAAFFLKASKEERWLAERVWRRVSNPRSSVGHVPAKVFLNSGRMTESFAPGE